ncbi:zinc-finger domain-containing protein [Altererythrobacter aurantiacus]|uniref:Zinc-finger domain-containing protein n=1 Tax=Parapontixanthobacter aurantiacus TaxID=1463599 RepID=A0A844ZGG8_9SPHN|nr:zinc-finger domain-containing protein [Parapontixanthobacter aurantiacus]MXO86644.1 zinc-finger domain-containing protein [Parapontixanthobacter aurantiacus]
MNIPPPEVIRTDQRRVSCDGASNIRGGAAFRPAALGHPRIWLEIDEHGYVDCGYCDRRFVLVGGPADGVDQAALRDISEGADPGHR